MYTRRRRIRRADAVSPWPFVGMGLLAATGFLYGASALVAPWWAVVALVLLWCLFVLVALAWWTPHPRRLPGLAGVAALVWFVVLVAGARWLGWG